MSNDQGDLKQALFAVSEAVLGAGVLIALGAYGGNWLDEKLHSGPWLSIGLSITGAGLGLARLVIKAQQINTEPGKQIGQSHQADSGETSQPRSPFAKWEDKQD